MGRSNWPPSIVPNENDQTVYLVANDFGKPGRAWAEGRVREDRSGGRYSRPATGQYSNPIRVVAFNTAEG